MSACSGGIRIARQDVRLLQQVANCTRITHQQLWRLAELTSAETNRKCYEWRIRRLAANGFVRKQRSPLAGGQVLYSMTRTGILALLCHGADVLSTYLEKNDGVEHQVAHTLALNEIQIALRESVCVLNWYPGKAVRLINAGANIQYAKIYDAVAQVVRDGANIDIAVEYEHTLKTPNRYTEIAKRLECEPIADVVLYVHTMSSIGTRLSAAFRESRKAVCVVHLERFLTQRLQAEIDCGYFRWTLREALDRICARKQQPVPCTAASHR